MVSTEKILGLNAFDCILTHKFSSTKSDSLFNNFQTLSFALFSTTFIWGLIFCVNPQFLSLIFMFPHFNTVSAISGPTLVNNAKNRGSVLV